MKNFAKHFLLAAVAGCLLSAALTDARAATNTVNNANDSGAGSLRQTIANSVAGDVVTFAPGLSGGSILLTSGQLVLNNNLTIDASALPGGITINGNQRGIRYKKTKMS